MTTAQMLHVWVEIADGRGHHGAFLRSFADAYTRADPDNVSLLWEASSQLIEKYELKKYLDNFDEAQ
jgi:hypothetical protein